MPGKSHGRRSLVGCSPWGPEESDMTERLHFHFSLSFIGEGNGNPLQCSCLENPRDRGAWWAAIYGVSQSRTRLKGLSSSSSSISLYILLAAQHSEVTLMFRHRLFSREWGKFLLHAVTFKPARGSTLSNTDFQGHPRYPHLADS